MNTTCKCGAEWTGKRLEHPDEMTERDMVRNDRGVWTLGGVNPWARVDAGAPNSTSRDSQGGDDETRRA